MAYTSEEKSIVVNNSSCFDMLMVWIPFLVIKRTTSDLENAIYTIYGVSNKTSNMH